MKTLSFLAAILFAAVLNTSAAVAAPTVDAQTAASTNVRVQAIQQALVAEGFTLQGTEEQPVQITRGAIRVAPYNWGNIVYTYTRPTGNRLLPVETVNLTAQVEYQTDSVTIPQISVTEGMAE